MSFERLLRFSLSLLSSFWASPLPPRPSLLPLFLEYGSDSSRKTAGLSTSVPVLLLGHLVCQVDCLLLLCLESPLLLPLFLYPASASQLCVGGCYFVREAVGILNSSVIISEEVHIAVGWQQHGRYTISDLCKGVPSGSRCSFCPCFSCCSALGMGKGPL